MRIQRTQSYTKVRTLNKFYDCSDCMHLEYLIKLHWFGMVGPLDPLGPLDPRFTDTLFKIKMKQLDINVSSPANIMTIDLDPCDLWQMDRHNDT